jgi:hypothetical protein
MVPHRRDRLPKASLVFGAEFECAHQSIGGVTVRVGGALLELLDSVDAQAGALGKTFLRQSGGQPVTPEQIPEQVSFL